MCCKWLAENTGRKKWPKIRHLGTITQLCPAVSLQLKHVSTIRKKLLNSNTSSICPHNMANFGPLAAEIRSRVRGTPANLNGFCVLACSVTARHSSSGRQPNFAALIRGLHLYSAGRPSRWALAHILVDRSYTVIVFDLFLCSSYIEPRNNPKVDNIDFSSLKRFDSALKIDILSCLNYPFLVCITH